MQFPSRRPAVIVPPFGSERMSPRGDGTPSRRPPRRSLVNTSTQYNTTSARYNTTSVRARPPPVLRRVGLSGTKSTTPS